VQTKCNLNAGRAAADGLDRLEAERLFTARLRQDGIAVSGRSVGALGRLHLRRTTSCLEASTIQRWTSEAMILCACCIVNMQACKHGASLTSPVALLGISLSLTHLQQILDGLIHDLEGSHIHGLHLCWQPPLLNLQEQTLHQCCAQACSRSVMRCFVFCLQL